MRMVPVFSEQPQQHEDTRTIFSVYLKYKHFKYFFNT